MDESICPICNEDVGEVEIEMHNGVCKCCYDDFYFNVSEEDLPGFQLGDDEE